MNAVASAGFKQKARHEMEDFLMIAVYLAFFFCAIVAYTMLVLRNYDAGSVSFAFALINALIIAKIILIGEMAHLGRKGEARSLYQSVLSKAMLFSLLVVLFHFVEEFVKRLFHGEPAGTALHKTDFHVLLGRTILIFCAFIPLFAFRELRRVLGEEEFYKILKVGHQTED
jgi:hypothetical protein